MSKNTYYDLLGVRKFAEIQEIQAAYRKAVKLVHPDVAGALPQEIMDSGIYHTIKEAYEVLSDPAQKRAYDAKLRKETLRHILFRPGLIFASILVYWYVKSPSSIPSRFPLHYTDGVFRVPSAAEWTSWLLTAKGAMFWHFLWSQHKMLVCAYIFAGLFVGGIAFLYFVYCLRTAKKAVVLVASRLPEGNLFRWRQERQLCLPEPKRSLVDRILKEAGQKNAEQKGRGSL